MKVAKAEGLWQSGKGRKQGDQRMLPAHKMPTRPTRIQNPFSNRQNPRWASAPAPTNPENNGHIPKSLLVLISAVRGAHSPRVSWSAGAPTTSLLFLHSTERRDAVGGGADCDRRGAHAPRNQSALRDCLSAPS